jgi:TusA-related sulfurtransferase
MDYDRFIRLLKDIEESESKKISRSELICITQLVFYSGIIQKEIIRLRVSDVVDADGNIKNAIKTKKILKKKSKGELLEIILQDRSRQAISEHLAAMRGKNPSLVMKRKSLFPSYRSERTIKRHWKEFYTNYNEIREGGMKSHYARNAVRSVPLSKIYLSGGKIFRIWPRSYYAAVADKKIRSGIDVNDEKQIHVLLKNLQEAERINPNSPTAQSHASQILDEAREALAKIINERTRHNHSSLVDSIRSKLARHIK